MSKYFPKPASDYKNIKVKIDLTNYATKKDIEDITHVDTSNFALKANLANLKTEIDKLDIDKLLSVPLDLSKLSNVAKNAVVKKTVYDKLVAKVYNIDTSDFLLKTKYSTDKTELENKIPDISNLVKKTDYNTKITELENKIPAISNLVTKTTLTTVENIFPSISNLATKIALTTVENDTSKLNTLAAKVFNERLAQANLIAKTDFDAKLSNLNRKITANKTRRGKQYFDEGSGKQNYLVFLPLNKYFKLNSVVDAADYVGSWQSKGLSDESIKPPTTSDNSPNPELNYYGTKTRVKFTGSCLKQSSHILTHKKIVNIYIAYELAASSSHTSDPTIKNCLFGAVNLTKNADIEKYKYSGYGIGFDRRSSFSFLSGGFRQNVLIFGADMSSSIHVDNKKKDILAFGREPRQGLESTLTAEKLYSINFTVTKKKFCLSLHYNRANSYLFVNGTEMYKFKAKDSAIVASPLYLGNISKDWSTDNMKKTGLTGYVHNFSADYNTVTVDDIKDIHKYFMKKII